MSFISNITTFLTYPIKSIFRFITLWKQRKFFIYFTFSTSFIHVLKPAESHTLLLTFA